MTQAADRGPDPDRTRIGPATGYRVALEEVGGEPAIVVAGPDDECRASIALRGATLLSWLVGGTDLTDGYRGRAELAAQDGVRNGILAPFPNRIAGGRYRFAGTDCDLLPGVRGDRTVYHGFARTAQFELVEAVATVGGARIVLRTQETRPGRHPGYPFALDIEVEYAVAARRFAIEIRATNVGDRTAPYAAGWHPYFRLGAAIDDLTLQIPAETIILTDEALIPVPGRAAYASLDRRPELDFRSPRRLADCVIDACFADLRAESVLRDPATGEELRIGQTSGLMHVFTGDTLARDRRASVALEPVEVPTDAFNRAECSAALLLEPGRTRSFGFSVTYATCPAV